MLSLIIATGFVLAQADGCSKDTDCQGSVSVRIGSG